MLSAARGEQRIRKNQERLVALVARHWRSQQPFVASADEPAASSSSPAFPETEAQDDTNKENDGGATFEADFDGISDSSSTGSRDNVAEDRTPLTDAEVQEIMAFKAVLFNTELTERKYILFMEISAYCTEDEKALMKPKFKRMMADPFIHPEGWSMMFMLFDSDGNTRLSNPLEVVGEARRLFQAVPTDITSTSIPRAEACLAALQRTGEGTAEARKEAFHEMMSNVTEMMGDTVIAIRRATLGTPTEPQPTAPSISTTNSTIPDA